MQHKSTPRSRELTSILKTYRTKTGWNPQEFAQRLGWPTTKIELIENGRWFPTDLDVALFATECGVPAPVRRELANMADGDRDGVWVRPHSDGLPESAPGVLFQHESAHTIITYDPTAIPVILQDDFFVGADLHHRFDTEQAERHEFNRGRYHYLLHDRKGREVTCFLHESVLREVTVPFDAENRWRLYHELTAIIERGLAEVRVIPAARENVLRLPAFSLLRLYGADPVVCLPCETVTLILEGGHVAAYEPYVTLLDELALSSLESRDLIVEIAGGPEAIGTPPAEMLEAAARDGEPYEPDYIIEAMAAVQARREAAAAADTEAGNGAVSAATGYHPAGYR